MTPRDRAILRYLGSPQGIIFVSVALTVGGTVYILMTGRWGLSFFVIAALLPWLEHWLRRNKR